MGAMEEARDEANRVGNVDAIVAAEGTGESFAQRTEEDCRGWERQNQISKFCQMTKFEEKD